MKHLTENATIRGALKELIEGNGWTEVIMTLDFLFRDPDHFDDEANPDVEDVTVPMSVDISFPRRRTLAEKGQADYSKVYPTDN